MLRSLSTILGYRVNAVDEEIGSVADFFLDDESWFVRYLVIDTGTWLPGRKVLISPVEAGEPDWAEQSVPVDLTAEQIQSGPTIQSDLPISRRKETEIARHYGWPHYWEPLAGFAQTPAMPTVPIGVEPEKMEETEEPETHLRSVKEILGYSLKAEDDRIGKLEDLIVETEDWHTHMLVVDTRAWLPGKSVTLYPEDVTAIDWAEQVLVVEKTVEQIRNGPRFDPEEPVNRELEIQQYDYYGRPVPKVKDSSDS